MSDQVVITECEWGTLVELNRPERRNALDPATVDALWDAVTTPGEGAIVLHGRGPVFCAGGDLHALAEMSGAVVKDAAAAFHRLMRALFENERPTIAAVRGAAVGGGLSLALACDVRIAGRSASFVPGWLAAGAVPDGGGSALLAASIGALAARQLTLTGGAITADSPIGRLVCESVDDDRVLERAVEVATQLAALPPLARHETKRLMSAVSREQFGEALDREYDSLVRVLTGLSQ